MTSTRSWWAGAALSLLVAAAFYAAFGLPIELFRAESGLFLAAARQGIEAAAMELSGFLTRSYNGHYIPVAAAAEMGMSLLFGGHGALWFGRQILAMAALMIGVAFMVFQAATSHASPRWSASLAAASAVLAGLNVTMATLLPWPFMALQLICMALAAFAGGFTIRFARSNAVADAWWACGLGYAAMHFNGVGLAGSLTALLLVAMIAGLARNRAATRALLVFGAITVVHAALMARGQNSGMSIDLARLLFHFAVLYGVQLIQSVIYLLYPSNLPWGDFSGKGIVFALVVDAVVVVVAIGLLVLVRRARWRALAVAGLFPLIFHAFTVALEIARVGSAPGFDALMPFTFGGRYLCFPIFAIAVGFGALALNRPVAAMLIVVGLVWVPVTSAVWLRTKAPIVLPDMERSHQDMWNMIMANPTRKFDMKPYLLEFGNAVASCVYGTGNPDCVHDPAYSGAEGNPTHSGDP